MTASSTALLHVPSTIRPGRITEAWIGVTVLGPVRRRVITYKLNRSYVGSSVQRLVSVMVDGEAEARDIEAARLGGDTGVRE